MLQVNVVSSTRNSATEPGMMFFSDGPCLARKASLTRFMCACFSGGNSPQKDTVWVSIAVWRFFFVSLLKNVWFSVFFFFFQQFFSWQHLKPDFELFWGWWNMAPTSLSLWALCIHCQTASWSCLRHCYPPLLKWRQACASQASCEIQQTPPCFQEIFSFFFLFFKKFLFVNINSRQNRLKL